MSLNPLKDAEERCIGGIQNGNSSIAFNPDDQCALGYGYASCMSCIKDYAMVSYSCEPCKEASILNLVGVVVGLQLFLFIIFAVIFLKIKEEVVDETNKRKKGCCGDRKKQNKEQSTTQKKIKKTKDEKIAEQKSANAVSRMVGDLSENMRVNDKSGGSGGSGGKGGNDANRDVSQVLVDRIKVFYGWMQVFSALTYTFDIPWPMQLKSFSVGLGIINVDIGFVSSISCGMAVPFLQKMAIVRVLYLCCFILFSCI